MTIAIYERVSSKKQDLASQHADLATWAQDKEVKWYSDKFTGKTMDRPGMTKLLGDIRAGKVKTLVCWRLDRLGRTTRGLTALFEELTQLRVNLISLRDGVDLSTPAGRLIANVLASVAAYETEVRGERITAGIAVKKARGEKWNNGRPKGSRHKATPEVREQVMRLKAENTPVAKIARLLHLSRQTVYTIMAE